MAKLPGRIKQRRQELGMTLLDLAKLTGVQEATVQRWESGEIKTVKYETVEKLAEVLKCEPVYLMGWDESASAERVTEHAKEFSQLFSKLTEEQQLMIIQVIKGFLASK